MRWLLLYKVLLLFGPFTAIVLSCSPEINNKSVISISLSNSPNLRIQLYFGYAKVGNNIVTYDSGDNIPNSDEIFVLTQPIIGSYEFRPFEYFYRTIVVEMTVTNGGPFILNSSTGEDNQRFSIDCESCNNFQTNSANWTQYHSSCIIKNIASNLCMNNEGPTKNVTQIDCTRASRWDLFGITTDLVDSYCTPMKAMNASSDVQISKGGLVGIVFGSIIGTSLVTLIIGYCFIKHHMKTYPKHALNM
ncbi:hypothetical protein C1645_780893 [Glomus cerebriforme]|uniref:Uncharacterized protein n=1 Tax=Glomus cerebriforme TaxID=658196 RepID=A0A397SIM5_9GLOM|nr:hypothetical protein C1645_780893 [Glomus cerebriforme]